mmetsp:Transcript_31828/g.42433  ORF Transcript_31828/g.42433 Transcript_31828/m.42433 type:complete len:92 (-) Transcript_31828:686-961(-)
MSITPHFVQLSSSSLFDRANCVGYDFFWNTNSVYAWFVRDGFHPHWAPIKDKAVEFDDGSLIIIEKVPYHSPSRDGQCLSFTTAQKWREKI